MPALSLLLYMFILAAITPPVFKYLMCFQNYLYPAVVAYCCLSKYIPFYSVFQARLFDEPQLASLCLENIDKNTGDALAAEGFTDIDLGNA